MLSESYRLYDQTNTLIAEVNDFDEEFDELFGAVANRDENILMVADKYNAYKIIHSAIYHGGQVGNENDERVYQREVLQSDE